MLKFNSFLNAAGLNPTKVRLVRHRHKLTAEMLIIVGGLPGVGKTTISRELALKLGAMHLRIDSIEQAIRDSGELRAAVEGAGYLVAYAVAEDNLKLGRTVIADSVNPLPVTRDAWSDVATRARVKAVEIEFVCSDPAEHRHRVENRVADIPGHRVPTWQEVLGHDYLQWDRERIVIDTAHRAVEDNVEAVVSALGAFS
jgi:predicted kinase